MSRNRARSVRFEFRCTPDEAAFIDQKVAESGMSRTEFFIKSMAEKEINIYPGLENVLAELKREGINLNQCLRFANHDQMRVPELREAIKNCNKLYLNLLELWQNENRE